MTLRTPKSVMMRSQFFHHIFMEVRVSQSFLISEAKTVLRNRGGERYGSWKRLLENSREREGKNEGKAGEGDERGGGSEEGSKSRKTKDSLADRAKIRQRTKEV